MDRPKIDFLFTFYDHPNPGRGQATRDRVFGTEGIAPCLPAAMGSGGGIIPYILIDMNKRPERLLASGKVDPGSTQFLDCYNQAVYEDISPTITTRINECSHYYISESAMPDYEYRTMPNGNIRAYSPRRGDGKGVNGYHFTNPDNIHPTLTSAHEPLIMEKTENTDRVMLVGNTTPTAGLTTRDNPQRGRTYDPEGISPTIGCMEGGNRQPQIIERVGDRDKEAYSVSDIAFTILASDTKRYVLEPQMMGHYRPEGRTSENVPYNEYVHRPKTDGIADTITSTAGKRERMIAEPVGYAPLTGYRIRRLTPRECFRLMDVDEWAIDRIMLAKDKKGKPLVSRSQQYKMAGNSICVNVLQSIFYKMFIETEPTKPYQMNLFD